MMSRIYKFLKKIDELKNGDPRRNNDDSKNMDISEIKRKIMEKIEKEKDASSGKDKAAALAILSGKLGAVPPESQATVTNGTEDLLKEPKKRAGTIEPEKLLEEYRENYHLSKQLIRR